MTGGFDWRKGRPDDISPEEYDAPENQRYLYRAGNTLQRRILEKRAAQVGRPIWTDRHPSGFNWEELDALCDWIGREEWTFFVTITAKHELTSRSARRAAERFHRVVNELFPGTAFFWVTEGHREKAGVHIHGLLRLPAPWHARAAAAGEEKQLKMGAGAGPFIWPWQCVNDAARWAVGGKAWRSNGGFGRWHRTKVDVFEGARNPDGRATRGAVRYCTKYLTKELADWDYFAIL